MKKNERLFTAIGGIAPEHAADSLPEKERSRPFFLARSRLMRRLYPALLRAGRIISSYLRRRR